MTDPLQPKFTVGLMVFPGFEMLDAYGPLEMFSIHRDIFTIKTFGPSCDAVRASGGPSTQPDAKFEDTDRIDILLVPGGCGVDAVVEQSDWLDWVSQRAKDTVWVTSVCTGALILARAGVLHERAATTNKNEFDKVVREAGDSSIKWRRKARWVVDGNVLTSSGVSAGMDMSLDLIERILGADAANEAARLAEYVRNPDPDDDPFAKENT